MLLNLLVTGNQLHAGQHIFTCAHGKGGFSNDKREGDGATPLGIFPLRQLLYRADRESAPRTALPISAIAPDDGWCDAPEHPHYNVPVKTPFAASHEKLWRDEHVYDFIIPLGYNDAPPHPGKGSAIFLHLAKPGYTPTEGCIALSREDFLWLLPQLTPKTRIEIRAS
jgi:L,D-peptidoglycan transpeptidase YkuD (ErfK/YbiS/YcfS/YnhG family)